MITLTTAIVLLAACGTPAERTTDIAVLADRAERLAEHLEAGDGCRAEREGEDLVARTRDAVAAERLPVDVGEEVLAVVAGITAAVPCEEPEETPAEHQRGATEEEREAAEEAREEAEEEAEEAREEAEAEAEEAREEAEEEGSGRRSSENGPPGRSEEVPPGQRGDPEEGGG